MHHEYYYYNKEQLLSTPKIPMEVMADKPTVFQAIAREMADFIKAQNEQANIALALDGQDYIAIPENCHVVIKKAGFKAKFLRTTEKSFYTLLREKLAEWK